MLQRITLYQRRQKITSLDTIEFLDTHVCTNNSHWQSSGIIFLCKCNISYTGRLFLGCVLFSAYSDIIKASWETKKDILSYRKKYIEEFVWGTLVFRLRALLSMSFFVAFFVYSLPLSKWRTCWMALIKVHNISMVGDAFSFSFSGYDITLIKKSQTLNFYLLSQKFLLKTKTRCR